MFPVLDGLGNKQNCRLAIGCSSRGAVTRGMVTQRSGDWGQGNKGKGVRSRRAALSGVTYDLVN